MNTIPRWLVAVIAVAILVMVGGSVWFCQSQRQQFQREAEEKLEAVARLKMDQIVRWRAETSRNPSSLIHNPLFAERVRQCVQGSSETNNSYRLVHWLQTLQEQNHALRVLVLDTNGNVRLAFPVDKTYFGPIGQSSAVQAVRSNQTALSDLHRNQVTGEIHMDLVVPMAVTNAILAGGVEVFGAIDMEVDPQALLFPLIQSWPMPSRTAETLLVRREGDEVVFLSELRHQKGSALSLRIPIGKENLSAAMAARGQEGMVMGTDYRGVPVVACVRAVPDSPWFLVAKMDVEEAFAGWRSRSLLIAALLIGSTFTLILLGVAVWQRFAKAHYRALLRVEERQRHVESNYLSLFDNMLNGFAYCRMIYLNDQPVDFIYLTVNEAFGALTGLKNVVGRRVSEVIPGICEKDPELMARYGRVARTGVHEMFEAYVESLGQWFSISVYQPEPDHFAAVFDVITKRKQAEMAMGASEARYRRLFESAKDGILILDARTGMVVDVNPFLIEMLGYSHEVFCGKKIWELGFLKDIVANQDNFAELQQKEYIRYENMPLETGDGRRIEVEFVSNVYLVNQQKVIQCNIRDITKRKKAEAALRASEERFRLVSDTANDAIISADSDGRVVYWNRAAQKMFGYSAEEIIGQPLGVLMPERFRQRHAEGLRRFLDGGESRVIGRTVELVAGRKDRTEFPIQLSLANWQMDGRQFFTGFIRDITEREAHEREIKRLNRLYEALSQINQTVTHARERERFMTDVCEVAVKLGGLKTAWIAWIDPTACAFVSMASAGDEQEILQHLKVLVEGDQPEQHPVADCIREGRPYVLNNIETATPPVAWRDKAKQSGTLALAAFPIGSNGSSEGALVVHSSEVGFFGDKEVTLLVEAAADISFGLKHLKHDQQRQESEERYRLLADHAEDFVALHDAHGNRLYVSPSYYRVTGWTPEEIRQIHWRERLHPEDVSIVERARSANLEGQSTIIEHRVRCKQGGWIWVEARCKPILGADGKVERMVVWSRDITDRKLAWEEIRRLNETLEQRVTDRTAELETANKELEAFSYSVSHDLRAPLRGISGYVGMLVEDHAKQLDAEGQRLLGVVSTEACRMGQLIDDLLEFARLGQQAMQSAEIDMGALAQKAFDECAAVAPERQIKLMLHPLPAAWGDAAMIPHVWGNLISNAVKYTRPRAAAEIEITGRADTGEVVYCVKDNGVGFDMKYAGKLFGVFQRLHSDADFEGTGVGLALVQRVVHRHGGRVWAESTLGEGAAFYFTLPDSAKVGS